jgi:DNA-directed RNA polymerase subunit RPC12/RpoP
MLEDINSKYTKKDNNWFCNNCNREIYSGKNYLKIFCSCLSKKSQTEIYVGYLSQYYNIVDSKYVCKKCSHSISSTREQHALKCIGIGTRYNSNGEINQELFSKFCDMGCGTESKFFYKSGKAYCSKQGNSCPVKKAIDSKKKLGSNNFANRLHPNLGKAPHNKGLTKETSEVVAKTGLAIKKSFELNGDQRKNKNHTPESKKKLSEKIKERYASGWEPVCGRAKKYKHSSAIAGDISVDGTWELAFAQILDKVNIKWERNRKRFDYINLEGGMSTYQPDFFIHEWDTFCEVKGYQTDLDICKWKQFNKPLLILKRKHINKIKEWLKDGIDVSKSDLFDLIKESTKESILIKKI